MLLEPVANPRWFVTRKTGQLVTFDPDNATVLTTHIDLSGVVRTSSEGGLLGLAFHPNYPATPEIFLSYTINHTGPNMRSVISRFILDNVTSPGAGTIEQVILQVDQDRDNHNGGDIAFGPDGYLYVGFGDGGGAGDPNNRAQDTTRLLGSMLRIDVTGPGVSFPGNPYNIPADNPFSGNAECGPAANANDCPEIYAWGLRNPWRWSFDSATGDLWLADVGQGSFEEVDLIERGGNYGWRCREGAHDFNTAGCGAGYVDPITEYGRGLGNSITGGQVYRGTAIPEIVGQYIFADYGSGRIWALQPDGQGGYFNDELIDTNFGPTSFAADENGELYFTDINNGRIRSLAPAGAPAADTIPNLLSATGCTDPADITRPYSGLVPYDINAPFWSDGAAKDRHIGLPNGTTITRTLNDDWEFPNGTVIVKNFRLNGNLIETRHLMRHPDGVWAGYTYEWNVQQTEATRVQGGKVVATAGQDWIYPSESGAGLDIPV
jgi:glucose/arabinose dehydrogenase